MSLSPALSIVVISRDRSSLLARCLASLTRQDAAPETYEVIVVDDGSTDDTPSVVRGFQSAPKTVRYVRQPPTGISAARNAGWKQASGGLVAFVADDYQLPRDYVSHVVSFFERIGEAAAVRFRIEVAEHDFCSRVSHFYFDVDVRNNLGTAGRPPVRSLGAALRKMGRRLPEHGREPTADHTLPASGAAAFRAGVLEALGGFDERFVRAEDADLARRMRRRAFALYYDPSLTIRRTYFRSLRQAFRAQCSAGCHLARYEACVGATTAPRQIAWALLRFLGGPPWRARQAGSLRTSLLLLPFMYWLELGRCAGLAWGAVRAKAG